MSNGINKVFVNLGVALIILGLVAAGMQMRGVKLPYVDKEFKEAAEVMRKESIASHDNSDFEVASSDDTDSDVTNDIADASNSIETRSKKSTRKSSSSDGEWVKTGTRVCVIGWNNKDFHEGWCKIGNPKPGEYRFKVRSSLQSIANDGIIRKYAATGTPISRFELMPEFVNIVNNWSPIQNGLVGKVIFKIGDESPIDDWEFTVSNKETVYASINFPQTEDNWKTQEFSGKITVDIFKKKS